MITRLRLERMGRGRRNAPKRFVVGGGPTKSDRFLTTLATALNMDLELPEGADEATARGLADLIAYDEEAAARRERGENVPEPEAFLDELRQTARPCEVVKPDGDWVDKLDKYYAKFVRALGD
jgi:sugar (pentulose or hexulose) kinase